MGRDGAACLAAPVTRLRRAGGGLAPRARPFDGGGLVIAAAAGAISFPAQSQVVTDAQNAPTLTIERYPEDWSRLADPRQRTGRWTERFKYLPLDRYGTTYLTAGVEVRARYEGYQNLNWGSLPDDDYVWYRVMPYADLHVGRARLFVQPIVAGISGISRAKTPVDATGSDMLQGFAELELEVADRATLSLSAGRKLISLGAGRFIDTRYGPNVPLAFDGVDSALASQSGQVRALYLRPVDTKPGDLNDRTSRQKAVWGLYATRWLTKDRKGGFDIYYLGFRDRVAVFDQGRGRAMIHTFGVRLFGDEGSWYWNLEGVLQRGSFNGKRVVAGGVGGELGRRFRNTPLTPVVALTLDYISGDRDPDDGKLGTFNPMFPRGKYFAAQSPIGPRNLIHAQPSITVFPHEAVALSLTGVAYWRESRRDGIYSIPGLLVRSGRGSDARFIGKQLELAVSWQATAELNVSVSVSDFDPGRFIRETGPARTMRVVGAMANFRF